MTYAELREARRKKLLKAWEENGDIEAVESLLRYQLLESNEASEIVNGDRKLKGNERIKILLRDYTSRLPENLVCEVGSVKEVLLTSLSHWIIRRELQYVGDQLAPDRTLRYVIGRYKFYNIANKGFKKFNQLYDSLCGGKLKIDFKSLIDSGRAYIFGIDLANNQQYVVSSFGWFICIPRGHGVYKVYTLFDTASMLEQEFDVLDSVKALKDGFESLLEDAKEIEYIDLKDYDSIGKEQRGSRKPLMSTEEMMKMREDEYKMQLAEDEAFRNHCTVEEVFERWEKEKAEEAEEEGRSKKKD